jgi:hypothetical protein
MHLAIRCSLRLSGGLAIERCLPNDVTQAITAENDLSESVFIPSSNGCRAL